MADAVQALGQYVRQKAANELVGWQGHGLVPVRTLDPVILPLERDAGLVGGDQPAIGDGDAVGVARQIREHGLRPAERRFSILPIIPELESRFVTPTTRCIGRQPQSCA